MIKELQTIIRQQLHGIDQIENDHYFFYGNHITGDLIFNDGMLTTIHVEIEEADDNNATIDDIKALAHKVIEEFDDRPLKLDVIIDFDTHYLAIFEQRDDQYNLPLPYTGAQISISYAGNLTRAVFYHPEIAVKYDELIPAQKAKAIIQRGNLVMLSILDEPDWHFAYTANYDVEGVAADGTIIRLSNQPELSNMGYEPLPEITGRLSLDALLRGDQLHVMHEKVEDSDRLAYFLQQHWDEEELEEASAIVQKYSKQQLFERACEALSYLVGEEYHNYKFVQDDGLDQLLKHAPFHIEMPSEQRVVTFQFVYFIGDIGIHFHPVEINIDVEFATIESISLYKLPYDKLRGLPNPIITFERANEIARELVDVELTFQRSDLENNIYTLMYNITYPPHDGNIAQINAYTGEVIFIETGFVR